MAEDDLHQLHAVFCRAVDCAPLNRRDLERALRLRNGALGQVLSGDTDLKVSHVMALARLLRIPPGDLFAAGSPGLTATARYRLADWLGISEPASKPAAAVSAGPAAPALPAAEDLVEMIRTLIREELAAQRKP